MLFSGRMSKGIEFFILNFSVVNEDRWTIGVLVEEKWIKNALLKYLQVSNVILSELF